jgi:hypothetical protein
MKIFRCRCCGKRFNRNNRLKGDVQHYCNSEICQRKRKSEWAKQKYKNNESYRKNKLTINKKYKSRSLGYEYQRHYRKNHPEYVEECRKKQRENYKKRVRKSASENIVNLDASHAINNSKRGIYMMYNIKEKNRVNLDALSLYNKELQSFMSIKPKLVLLL